MVHHKNAQEKFNQLRRQAEALMAKPGFSKTPVGVEDPLRLIHELQTFQVELELQNDELCRSYRELMDFKIHYTHSTVQSFSVVRLPATSNLPACPSSLT
jgi:hypothetical protein